MDHKLVNVQELARKLNVSCSAVYKMTQNGTIKPIRVGPRRGGLRFDVNEILAVLSK